MSLTYTRAFGVACVVLAQSENPFKKEAADRAVEAFSVFDLTDDERDTVLLSVSNLAHPGLLSNSLAVIIEAAVERAYFKRKAKRGTKHG